MPKPASLRRAKDDENAIALKFNKYGYPAIRIPGSGCSKFFPGDVLAFGNHVVHLRLVRRAEPTKCPRCKGKGWLECPVCKGTGKINPKEIVFTKEEILDVMKLASKISALIYPIGVEVGYDCHFPKQRKWISGTLSYGGWDGKDKVVKLVEERR